VITGRRGGVIRRFTLVWLAVAVATALAGAPSAQATGRGLVVLADTLEGHALEPLLVFSNGAVVDAQALALATAPLRYRPGDLFVYDLAGGGAWVAEAEVGDLALVSALTPGGVRLKALFDAPGVVVLFESDLAGPADPLTAEAYSVHRPLGGNEPYERALTSSVPEPDAGLMLACGAAMLAVLRRVRPRDVGRCRGAPLPTA